MESFKTGRDHGIDLRYAEDPSDSFIVQCKHYARSSVSKLLSDLRITELPKVQRLNPARYLIVTSLPLSPIEKDNIRRVLHPFISSTHDVLGSEDLNNLLRRYALVEQQHFKLWMSSTAVLQRVLQNAERVQTEFGVERILRRIPLYVQTPNFQRALKILDDQRVAIISGVPGIGKTTLADMLLFRHIEAGYQPVLIKSEISEARKQLNRETKQIFYYDDFLGETFLSNRFDFFGKREDSAILDFIELVLRSTHARLILTTRDHILQHAFQVSEHFKRQRGPLADSRCILNMHDYSILDRGRILYNHIYFSDLPPQHRNALLKDDFYLTILHHRNFNPRLVEWLTRYTNVNQSPAERYTNEVERVLENPEQLWRIAFEQQISEAARSVLLSLYSLGGEAHLEELEEVWKSLHQYRVRKYNRQGSAGDWRCALQDLEGGFLKYELRTAKFVNPSVRDFLDLTVATDTQHFEDVLAAACRFEQVVRLWSLASSKRGRHLRDRLAEAPEQIIGAVNANLNRAHEQRLHFGEVGYGIRKKDTQPEIRLRTIISIADQTRSSAALTAAKRYLKVIRDYWRTAYPDFGAGTSILEALDATKWTELATSGIHEEMKDQLLCEAEGMPTSSNVFALVSYAERPNSRWTRADDVALKTIFKDYLEPQFDYELSESRDKEDLEDLLSRLGCIESYSMIPAHSQRSRIEDRLSGLVEDWEEDSQLSPSDATPACPAEHDEEAEVRRLFEGLN